MKASSKRLMVVLLISVILITSCNLPNGEPSDVDATAVAETAVAVFTQAAETAQIATLVVPTETMTASPVPTNTLVPTQPVSATNTPIPCNRANFVKDVTYPDNAVVLPGTVFTKTWQLKNTGSCSWTSGYVLIFDHGDAMNAPTTVSITSGTVAPGAIVEISVELTAPTTPGTYQGYFLLRSPDNIVFGLNADAQGPFWVKIVVPSPTATPSATTVPLPDLYISDITYSPVAPKQGVLITVKVTVYNKGEAAAGAFTVEWYPANGSPPPANCIWPVASSNAHGGYVLTCTYTYGGWNHAYETRAVADSANTVTESNEANNVLKQTLDVSPP